MQVPASFEGGARRVADQSCDWCDRPAACRHRGGGDRSGAVLTHRVTARRGTASGKQLVRVSPKFYRPAEVELLIGDPAKAKRELGWEPKTTLEELCQMMVDADLRRNEIGFSF